MLYSCFIFFLKITLVCYGFLLATFTGKKMFQFGLFDFKMNRLDWIDLKLMKPFLYVYKFSQFVSIVASI